MFKKNFKRIIAMALTVIMMMSMSTSVFAVESGAVEPNDSVPYVFPIKPGSDEWKSFITKEEKVDVCQIPENKMMSMTTTALLESVLKYPLLTTYSAFNSTEDAFRVISNDFNGLRELLAREDVTSVIFERYSNTPVMHSTDDSKSFLLPSTLEFLISCDQLSNGEFHQEETILLERLIEEKDVDRTATGMYSINSNIYANYVKETLGVSLFYPGDTLTPVINIVKTPKGSYVQDVYKRSPDFTAAEKKAIADETALSFPNAELVSAATVKYNCHSYAWYQQSSANPYWIDSPGTYIDDGSYVLFTDISPRLNMKAYYNDGEHSGVVQKTEFVNGSRVTMIQSKWGQTGLYLHYPSDTPYSTNIDYYMISGS